MQGCFLFRQHRDENGGGWIHLEVLAALSGPLHVDRFSPLIQPVDAAYPLIPQILIYTQAVWCCFVQMCIIIPKHTQYNNLWGIQAVAVKVVLFDVQTRVRVHMCIRNSKLRAAGGID